MFKKLFSLWVLPVFLQAEGYYPSGTDLLYPHQVHANPQNWCHTIKTAPQKTTVILEDGIYKGSCKLKNKTYITIKAAHQWGAKYRGNGYFIECEEGNSHIHILGMDVSSKPLSKDSGVLKMHGYQYYNHHAYVGNCWIHDTGGAIMTGPTVHDVTVDNCLIHDIKLNYYWYAMGWHLSFSNNTAYHPENDGVMCRGHYPINKRWRYGSRHDVRVDKTVKNLPKDDWTHRIVGNTFAQGYGRCAARRWDRGAAVSFYIGWNNDKAEESYFPPQNVLISDNVFYDITPSFNREHNLTVEGAIAINEGAGFPKIVPSKDTCHRVGVIKGTIIKNNVSNAKLLKEFWNPNISLIKMQHNQEYKKISSPLKFK